MFCQMKTYAKCDISKIQSSLYDTDPCGDNWLNECHVCLSTCGTILAIAKGHRVTISHTQWDTVPIFVPSSTRSFSSEITSVFSLPVSTGESREKADDWVCIIIGFKSGEITFCTSQGEELFTEKYDDSPVLKIKCYTGLQSSKVDEINILYSDSVCCLSVPNLMQLLQHAKIKYAKVGSKPSREAIMMDGNNIFNRKLGIVNQDVICDASVIGLELSNTYDHLLTASLHGGFFTGYRMVAPQNTVVVGVGARPFVAFHQAIEGGTVQPILNDVARAVASKIKSALPGWLGGKSNVENAVIPPPPSDRMLCRFALTDLHRKGLFCTTSPDRRFLAVIDSMGRVLLIDVRRGVAVRMFKGYRNSQCGFLQVNEESSRRKGFGRRLLFLVLYVGKHGLLEIWPLRGPRIAAFSTVNNALLLYYPHNLSQHANRRTYNHKLCTLSLLLPDGKINQISVPFHFGLNSEDSERTRDVHIVKRLRQILKDKYGDYEESKNEIIKTILELKNIDMKINCVEMMSSHKNIQSEILSISIQTIKTILPIQDEPINPDVAKLDTILENLESLIRIFSFASDKKLDDQDSMENRSESSNVLAILTDVEIDHLLHLLQQAASTEVKRIQHAKVTFVDEKKSTFYEFLSSFNLNSDRDMLFLKESVSDEMLLFISRQIFNCFISGDLEWRDYEKYCANSKNLSAIQLRNLLLIYWNSLSVQEITRIKMEKFASVMYDLCQMQGFDNVYAGYSETSMWWQDVRDILVDSSSLFKSMVSSQLCRAVARKIEKEEERKEEDYEEDIWESVSRDSAQWGLLVGKLDDISLLSIILTQKPELHNKLPIPQLEIPEINLKYIYTHGKGSISELTALWLCTAGVDPLDIIKNDKNKSDTDDETDTNRSKIRFDMDERNTSKLKVMSLFDKLNLLKKQFPFSLNYNSLIVNMYWEYVKYWSKNIEDVVFLEASMKCLKALTSKQLRCGICAMAWSAYLVVPFETSYKLISKVGKLPREKLTQQNIGISDIQLLKILEIITEFLDYFVCGLLSVEEDEPFVLKFEEMWEESCPSLTELAIMKSDVNVDALQLHYQLSAAIYYQCFLGINFWKHLVNLFDVESQKSMFRSLSNMSKFTLHHQMTDSRVMLQRSHFLTRLIHKCVDLSKDRYMWVERVQDLGRLWRVNDDLLRKTYALCLYSQGIDAEAEVGMTLITDLRPLLDDLIPIVARRLKHFVDCVDDRAEALSILTPQMTNYLQSLDDVPNELMTVTSLESTIRLLELTLAHSERRSDNNIQRLGHRLLDASISLQENMCQGK